MSRITEDQVKKVAELARLKLDSNQVKHHAEQIEKILDYVNQLEKIDTTGVACTCLLYTSPSPRDRTTSRMPSAA